MAKKYIITNTSEGVYNNANPIPVENIEQVGGDKGVIDYQIFRSPDGTEYKMSVANGGALVITPL